MRCNWRRWLWGLIPILLLGWLAVWAERDRVEADLGERARVALRQAGMHWAAARFEGRDADLRGTAADEADPQKAADLLRGVWGVRVVDNNAALAPMAEKFTWRASRRGQRIRLLGHVPNRAVRRTILGVAKASVPGLAVVDRMNTARGVPSTDAWLAGVSFALKQLSALKRGDVVLESLDLTVTGEAEDVEAYRAVRSALSSPPKGIKLAASAVKPPAVSPYTWSAKLEARQLVLTGHYPSDGAREQLLAAARASFSRAAIQDSLLPAEGAPQDWASAAVASVQAIVRLEGGSADLKDAGLTVSGVAADAATADAVRAALRAALPPSIKFNDQISAKAPPPPPPPPPPRPPAKEPEPPPAARVEPPPAPPPAPPTPAPPQVARVEPPSPPPPPAPVKEPEPPPPARVEASPPPPAPPKAPEPPQVARVEPPSPPPQPAPAKEPEPPPPPRVEAPPPPPAPPKAPEPPQVARVEPPSPPPPPAPKPPEPPQARIETPPPPPPPALSPAQLEAKACEERLGAIARSEPILFGFDSAQIDAASRPTLDKLAEAAKTCTDMRIEIAGHASAEGTAAFNHRLSLRRARSVAAYLLRAGVSADQLKAVGYGASQPRAPNDTDENKAKNRRIEFIVHPN
jgi:outer membrane protein OmpA-like peptidoglycan-associated protein